MPAQIRAAKREARLTAKRRREEKELLERQAGQREAQEREFTVPYQALLDGLTDLDRLMIPTPMGF